MLKQVSLKQALKMYCDGNKIQILREDSESGRLVMYEMNEILDGVIYLADIPESKPSAVEVHVPSAKEEKCKVTKKDEEKCKVTTENSEITKKKITTEDKRRKIDTGKLMALYNAGWSVKDIADELHCCPASVYNYIHKRS